MRESDLTTSQAQFHGLWDQVHKVRSTSRTVTVDKAALAAVLIDHSKMAGALFPAPVFGKAKWEA